MRTKTIHYNKDFDFSNPDFLLFKKEVELINFLSYKQEDVDKELKGILLNSKSKKTNINKKYFDSERFKTIVSNYSVIEVLNNDILLSIIFNIINTYEVLKTKEPYTRKLNIVFSMKTCNIAGIPSTFNINKCKKLLSKYNVNNIYYDPSMGWGDRMISAATLGLEYFGTDPNLDLFNNLNDFSIEINQHKDFNSKLYNQGSEVYIPELFDRAGLIFTSPPYFDLEKYEGGNQLVYSSIDYYKEYVKQTVSNCSRYLIEGGYFCININDKYYDLFYNEAIRFGLTFITDESYDSVISGKPNVEKKNWYVERIMIFKKIL